MQSNLKQYTEKLSRHPNKFFQDFTPQLEAQWVRGELEGVLNQFKKTSTAAEAMAAIQRWNEIKAHIQTHFSVVDLAYQCFTKDEALEKEERRLKEEVEPVCDEWNAKIREQVLASPFRRDLEGQTGAQYFAILKIQQDAFDPKNIEIETMINRVLSDYTKLTGGACVELDGKTYPISHYKKFANDADPRVRKESFLSYSRWYLQNRPELEKQFDQLVEFRNQMGRVKGFKNFTPLGYQKMYRVDYGPDEVARLREQIQKVLVPLARKIRARQAKSLGTSKVAAWNGDYFPEWKLGEMKVSVKDQPATALKVYKKLSPVLGAHFQKMLEKNLVDLEARDGKGPGAFCTDFSDYRVPYIFLNSVGEASDVTTMLHECGHSFQGWESAPIDLVELRWPTLEACEVHSMGMEFLAYPYYDEFLTVEDAAKYREKHLAESIFIMPYIAMVDEFQHLIYGGGAPGAEGRAAAWLEIEAKYGGDLDFSDQPDWQRYRWIRQLHIFRAPFYYIDYAIAQIGAWQLWIQSLADKGAAMANYLKLCRLGGTLPLKEFFAAGKLRLPFEQGMLEELVDQVLSAQPII
jgi:M3 family oligoendopeptidase